MIVAFSISTNPFAQEINQTDGSQNAIDQFFNKHKAYGQFKDEIKELYGKHPAYFWYKQNKISEEGVLLLNAAGKMEEEGLPKEIPYIQSQYSNRTLHIL